MAEPRVADNPSIEGIKWGRRKPASNSSMFFRLRCALVDFLASKDFSTAAHAEAPPYMDEMAPNGKVLWFVNITKPEDIAKIVEAYNLCPEHKITELMFRIHCETLQEPGRSPQDPEIIIDRVIADATAYEAESADNSAAFPEGQTEVISKNVIMVVPSPSHRDGEPRKHLSVSINSSTTWGVPEGRFTPPDQSWEVLVERIIGECRKSVQPNASLGASGTGRKKKAREVHPDEAAKKLRELMSTESSQ
ncbi:hypothetical protein B0O99DRAFT_596410 [Bisporella sp. PMI_857]|nr:hypothetical protein B0O99DRAFT_596410 [Bisporella sp. PMI_857]